MVDPLNYISFQSLFHSWCYKDHGSFCPVCRVVDVKLPLLLVGRIFHEVATAGVLSGYLRGPLP